MLLAFLHSYEIVNRQFSIVLMIFYKKNLLSWFDMLIKQCNEYCVPDASLQKDKLEKGSVKQTSFNMIHPGVHHLVLVMSLVKFWTVILMEKSIWNRASKRVILHKVVFLGV